MADIELVIKIPEECVTQDTCFIEWVKAAGDKFEMTILPKNHGDLIDRDKLEPDCYELEIHDGDDWRNEYCGVSLMQIEHYADVIIPATKEKNK